jgi:hypothetical protein
MLKARLPFTKAALAGKVALGSLEVIAIVSFGTDDIPFRIHGIDGNAERSSGSLGEGVPVFPEAVPGAAVSPGSKSCN